MNPEISGIAEGKSPRLQVSLSQNAAQSLGSLKRQREWRSSSASKVLRLTARRRSPVGAGANRWGEVRMVRSHLDETVNAVTLRNTNEADGEVDALIQRIRRMAYGLHPVLMPIALRGTRGWSSPRFDVTRAARNSGHGLHPDLMPLELRGIRAISGLHSFDRVQRIPWAR